MSGIGIRIAVGVAALVLCASGCRQAGTAGSRTSAGSAGMSGSASTGSSSPSGPVGAASTAAGTGSCHARGSGLYVLPDPSCTPGAANPAVTQADIGQTICKSGWAATVRPPESYTEPLKYRQMTAYGDTGSAGDYEEDHLISLELGGSPSSPQNLWPEPGASPNPKDSVENAANRAVCDGKMTLVAAQQAIASDWIAFGRQLGVTQAPRQTPTTQTRTSQAASGQTGTCTASSSYSSKFADWDVYVHSHQPDQTVTVTASGGETASYHTDSSGYADVYLHAPQSATGQRVSVTVGDATCAATL